MWVLVYLYVVMSLLWCGWASSESHYSGLYIGMGAQPTWLSITYGVAGLVHRATILACI